MGWMQHGVLAIEGRLDCVQFGAIMNKAATVSCVEVFV